MFRNYLSAALRNLERNSLYAGVTIFGLAVGFAAALLIALYVRGELTYDRFIPGHDRVYVYSERIEYPGERPVLTDSSSVRVGPALKAEFPQIQYAARLTGKDLPATVKRGDFTASESNLTWADPDFFRVMPLPVVAGDLASALDEPDGLVITRAIARKYFGRDAPIGQSLLINGAPMKVTAVIQDLPPTTHLIFDMYGSTRAPQSPMPGLEKRDTPQNLVVITYVRLQPGASAAGVDMGGFVRRHFSPEQLGEASSRTRITAYLVPLTQIHLRPDIQGAYTGTDPAVLAGVGAVGVLIVLVAAINFVTLMTARATRRAVEVGVRKAAGATRRDLIAQFMGEALIHVAMAGLIAAALAELVLPGFNILVGRKIVIDYGDPILFAALPALVLAVGLAAGAYPALVLSNFRPAIVLKGGLAPSGGSALVRQMLVVVQFAVLIGLILFATTITRQTLFAINQGMRLDKNQVLLVLAKPCTDDLRDAMAAVGGVEKAACASAQALNLSVIGTKATVAGRDVGVYTGPVDYDFFGVYNIAPLAGRLFDHNRPADGYAAGAPSNPPLVINETARHKLGFANDQAAIGKTVTWPFHTDLDSAFGKDPAKPSQIIGVVPDFTFGSMREPILPMLFMVGPKVSYYSLALNLRLDRNHIPRALAGIDQVWRRFEPGDPIQRFFVTEFALHAYIDTLREAGLIVAAALVALFIAALGLFALSAYTTERRTKEIGVRKAMGAGTSAVLRLLIWQFSQPVLWANLLAWPVAFLVMNWWLHGFAYHVDQAPWVFVAAGAAALIVAWATVFIHALRVARAKPVGALRYE
ncbi:MAG TPA: ABC transporter permease [Caulobacteraceae bacterium]